MPLLLEIFKDVYMFLVGMFVVEIICLLQMSNNVSNENGLFIIKCKNDKFFLLVHQTSTSVYYMSHDLKLFFFWG